MICNYLIYFSLKYSTFYRLIILTISHYRLVKWRDTSYEAPAGTIELEDQGLRTYSVLLYGQAMGECRIIVCLDDEICTDFNLNVVASCVLTPATALIAPGDTLSYR